MSVPNELQSEIIKFIILDDFHLISKLSLICKSFCVSIRKLLDSKEIRTRMIEKFLPKKFRTPAVFPKLIDEIFDGTISAKNFKRLFNFVFRQKYDTAFAQYDEMTWKPSHDKTCILKSGSDDFSNDFLEKYIHGTMISIGYLKIRHFPIELCKLTNLNFLALVKNKIKVVPKKIRKLVHLETLYLDYNEIEELPEEINELTSLKDLHVSNNDLRNLPKNFNLMMSHLKILSLHSNCNLVIPTYLEDHLIFGTVEDLNVPSDNNFIFLKNFK